jgi:hypothetical protein
MTVKTLGIKEPLLYTVLVCVALDRSLNRDIGQLYLHCSSGRWNVEKVPPGENSIFKVLVLSPKPDLGLNVQCTGVKYYRL